MIVPLHRQVKLGTKGPDALAVKRALHRKGFGAGVSVKGPLARRFGPVAVVQLRRFRKKYGIKVTSIYDRTAHRTMVNCGGFDLYGASLMAQAPGPGGALVSKILAAAYAGYNWREHIGYTQGAGRMAIVRRRLRPPFHVDFDEDCSSFATGCYWIAGAKDPNDRGFDGYGFTGTQINNGRRVDVPKPADLVFYGRDRNGNPTHVAIFVAPASLHFPNGAVISHGSSSGPLLLDSRYRHDRHSIRRYV